MTLTLTGRSATPLPRPMNRAERLLSVIDGLDAAQSGKVFDWAGAEIAP